MVNAKRVAPWLLAVIAAGLVPVGFAVAQPSAGAITDGCQNGPQPEFGVIGCGALFLPGVGYQDAGPALTLSALSGQFMSPVIVKPMNEGGAQDWTLFQVCDGLSAQRNAADPCGGGKAVPGEFVIEFTPYGGGPDVNSQMSLCLTDSGGRVLLMNCQAGSAFFIAGFPDPPYTDGAPPVVSSPVKAEVWTFTPGGQVVNAYSGRRLADPSSGGPGTELVTTGGGGPAADWKVTGCTAPFHQEKAAPGTMPASAEYGCIRG